MPAEVIAIGDELTSGQRLDTNSQWLSQRLGEIGIAVMYHTTVADDLEANVRVFKNAIERADVIVASGGLGPTADDLTREAIAAALDRPLVLDDAALAHITALFARRNREMPPRNRVQAMFPEGSRVIPNPQGTAPGIHLEIPRGDRPPCRLFALPGVPAEMFEMWAQTVVRELTSAAGSGQGRVIRNKRIKCFGVGESQLEQMLPDLIRRGRVPAVGITVHEATITLRITAEGSTPEACAALIAPTEATIRECLAKLVYGEEDQELEHAVTRLLADRGETLATAEGGTGGLVAHWIGEVAEARPWYRGGVVATTETALRNLLDVSSEQAAQGLSGASVARQMAVACRQRFGADYGLAVTPFPALDPAASTPPKFHLALATSSGVTVVAADHAGHSAILKPLAAKRALNLLRLALHQ